MNDFGVNIQNLNPLDCRFAGGNLSSGGYDNPSVALPAFRVKGITPRLPKVAAAPVSIDAQLAGGYALLQMTIDRRAVGAEMQAAVAPVAKRREVGERGRRCQSYGLEKGYAEIADVEAGELEWLHVNFCAHRMDGEIGPIG
jgi:hypothetical protein